VLFLVYIRLFHHEGSIKSITDKNIKVTGQGQEVLQEQVKEVNFFTKLCNEYNIVGYSPLIFDVFAKFRAVCLSVCISSFYVFICLPEW